MLYAASSAPDTDFTSKLVVDVHPDGYAQIMKAGIIRACYRKSFTRQARIVPGKTNEYAIDLRSMSHVLKSGHQIQVEISSSNFPKYDWSPANRILEANSARTLKRSSVKPPATY